MHLKKKIKLIVIKKCRPILSSWKYLLKHKNEINFHKSIFLHCFNCYDSKTDNKTKNGIKRAN